MNNPREIFRRLERRQASAPVRPAPIQPTPAAPVTPAPAPQSPPPPAAPAPARPPAPQPGHALYRELMRSHDRMGTRHLRRDG